MLHTLQSFSSAEKKKQTMIQSYTFHCVVSFIVKDRKENPNSKPSHFAQLSQHLITLFPSKKILCVESKNGFRFESGWDTITVWMKYSRLTERKREIEREREMVLLLLFSKRHMSCCCSFFISLFFAFFFFNFCLCCFRFLSFLLVSNEEDTHGQGIERRR
jgi:hypothetical protein